MPIISHEGYKPYLDAACVAANLTPEARNRAYQGAVKTLVPLDLLVQQWGGLSDSEFAANLAMLESEYIAPIRAQLAAATQILATVRSRAGIS